MNDTTSVVEVLEEIRAHFDERMAEIIKVLKKIEKNTEAKVDDDIRRPA